MTKEKKIEMMAEETVSKKKKSFFAKNWKWIAGGCGVVVLGVGVFCLFHCVINPAKEKSAAAEASTVIAQDYNTYSAPNYAKLATDAAKMAKEHEGRNAGNSAHLYEGIANYNQGKYAEAVKALEAYEAAGSEIIDNAAIAALGNCYACQKQYDKAVQKLTEAASKADNAAVSPIWYVQAGEIYELQLNDKAKALDCYNKAKSYVTGVYAPGSEIEKYIQRASTK